MNSVKITCLLIALAGSTVSLAQTTIAADSHPAAVTAISTGFDYSRGDYGFATSTEVQSVPLNLGYESGPWTFNAIFSYLTIKGPATVVAGSGTARPTSAAESGFGDIFASATYHFGPVVGPVNLDAAVRAKLPTAEKDRGLGTGAIDYYGEFTFSRTFVQLTPFATVGYRVLGDNEVYQLRDGAYASGGAHFRVSTASVITTVLNWRAPIVPAGSDSVDAMVMFTHDFDARWRIMAYVSKGFTDASPNVGTGVQVSYRF